VCPGGADDEPEGAEAAEEPEEDLLGVEIVDIEPDRYGFTVQIPGFGFLRDVFPEPFKVDWDIAGGWATSADLPGVRILGSPFMGTIGLSPGHELLAATTAREQALIDRGGLALPPSAAGAVPADPRLAAEGKIRHSLVVVALYHFELRLRGFKEPGNLV